MRHDAAHGAKRRLNSRLRTGVKEETTSQHDGCANVAAHDARSTHERQRDTQRGYRVVVVRRCAAALLRAGCVCRVGAREDTAYGRHDRARCSRHATMTCGTSRSDAAGHLPQTTTPLYLCSGPAAPRPTQQTSLDAHSGRVPPSRSSRWMYHPPPPRVVPPAVLPNKAEGGGRRGARRRGRGGVRREGGRRR